MPTVIELFSGTGSVGKVFRQFGWDVVSVDLSDKFSPTHCVDVRYFDYKALYSKGDIDFVWGSTPCTEYSVARTTAKRPRDLAGADELVEICKSIAKHYACPFAFENPQSGLLKSRDVVRGIPFTDTSYCQYGYPYRKTTRIWHSLGDYLEMRPTCCSRNPCDVLRVHGKHLMSAQRGPGKRADGTRMHNNTCSLDQLQSLPSLLCYDIALSVDAVYSEDE